MNRLYYTSSGQYGLNGTTPQKQQLIKEEKMEE
jgi:hypothetical protein